MTESCLEGGCWSVQDASFRSIFLPMVSPSGDGAGSSGFEGAVRPPVFLDDFHLILARFYEQCLQFLLSVIDLALEWIVASAGRGRNWGRNVVSYVEHVVRHSVLAGVASSTQFRFPLGISVFASTELGDDGQTVFSLMVQMLFLAHLFLLDRLIERELQRKFALCWSQVSGDRDDLISLGE